jgi:hypothetical protein
MSVVEKMKDYLVNYKGTVFGGCYARFVQFTENVGIKIFPKKLEMEESYEKQRKAYQLQLGPACAFKFQIDLQRKNRIANSFYDCDMTVFLLRHRNRLAFKIKAQSF